MVWIVTLLGQDYRYLLKTVVALGRRGQIMSIRFRQRKTFWLGSYYVWMSNSYGWPFFHIGSRPLHISSIPLYSRYKMPGGFERSAPSRRRIGRELLRSWANCPD